MTEKTHYRKAFHSPYLSAADITEPVVLTIQRVNLEPDKTKKTKDLFNTAYFVERQIRVGEPLKPMILNATNSKMLKTLTDSPFIDDWQNVAVTVFVDSNVKFGRETMEGLRIRAGVAPQKQPLSESRFKTAIDSIKADETKRAPLTAALSKFALTVEQEKELASC
jgi:hypothetical protein